MNVKEMTIKTEAEYNARKLYIELFCIAEGNQALLIAGLSIAMNIIKNDLVSLLPPPVNEDEVTASVQSPQKEVEKAAPIVESQKESISQSVESSSPGDNIGVVTVD